MSTDYIYFVRPVGMDGPVKIGRSFSPAIRVGQLSAWSPFPLEVAATIPGDGDLERRIQNCFANAHSHGEWFHPNAALSKAIAMLQGGAPIERVVDLTRKNPSVLGLIQAATRQRNGTKLPGRARRSAA